jgi:hypothetical protein
MATFANVSVPWSTSCSSYFSPVLSIRHRSLLLSTTFSVDVYRMINGLDSMVVSSDSTKINL